MINGNGESFLTILQADLKKPNPGLWNGLDQGTSTGNDDGKVKLPIPDAADNSVFSEVVLPALTFRVGTVSDLQRIANAHSQYVYKMQGAKVVVGPSEDTEDLKRQIFFYVRSEVERKKRHLFFEEAGYTQHMRIQDAIWFRKLFPREDVLFGVCWPGLCSMEVLEGIAWAPNLEVPRHCRR